MRSVWVMAAVATGLMGCVPAPEPYGAYVPGNAPLYAAGGPAYVDAGPTYAGPVAVPSTPYYAGGYPPYAAAPVVVPGAVGLVEFGGGRYRGYDNHRYYRDDRAYSGGYRGGDPAAFDRHPGGPPNQPPVARGPAPPQQQQRTFPNAQPGTHIVQQPGAPAGQGWVVPNGRRITTPGFPPG